MPDISDLESIDRAMSELAESDSAIDALKSHLEEYDDR